MWRLAGPIENEDNITHYSPCSYYCYCYFLYYCCYFLYYYRYFLYYCRYFLYYCCYFLYYYRYFLYYCCYFLYYYRYFLYYYHYFLYYYCYFLYYYRYFLYYCRYFLYYYHYCYKIRKNNKRVIYLHGEEQNLSQGVMKVGSDYRGSAKRRNAPAQIHCWHSYNSHGGG
ncbi:uncharacterized protein LOC121859912 [Homarus americanus]|uniref:uncharacterized protein LOC121859912 n=1 Tax=Homarus americanus TaxID=6706 RepID=UPI001C472432|nr:uncharacterized protein LOC121859912 [Homarus americanus]